MNPSTPQQAAIRVDSHLDGTHERSLADDVLDGLTPVQGAAAEAFL
jgi:hypothetical protein